MLIEYGQGKFSKKDFYSYFRDKIWKLERKEDVEKLWDKIIKRSEIYSQILEPRQNYWDEFYLPVLEVKILDLKLLYPLLICLKEKGLQGEKEVAIFKKLIIYSFRRRLKEEKIQQREALKWVDLAKKNQSESILKSEKIIREVEKSDDFWNELEQKPNLGESETKWLLTKFYLFHLSNLPLTKLQIEHMFPKKPDEEWFLISEWKELEGNKRKIEEKLNSLGNATLLVSDKNVAVNNKIWAKKKEEFEESCLINEENDLNLLEKQKLLPEDIDKRKDWLIQQFKESGILFIDEKKESLK